MEETKNCPYCKQNIDLAAIKCPHCREWLNKKEWSLKNPYVQALVWIIFSFIALFGTQKYLQVSQHKYKIEKYSRNSKVIILNHRLSTKKTSFSIIGEIENQEDFTWESLSLLATFTDAHGVVSGLGSAYIRNLDAHSTKAFEVNFGCSEEPYDPKKYANYTIEIEEGYGEKR